MRSPLLPALAILFSATAMQLSADYEVVGTIEATIGGEQKTWYILTDASDEAAAGAIWMILSDEEGESATAAIGGFESTDVVFSRDPDTGFPSVSGEGSQLVLSFEFPLGASSVEVDLPTAGVNTSSLLLLPTVGDYTVMHGMDEGTISVSRIEANRNGSSRFEGTFSGQLVDRDGEVLGRIANGRFKVDEAQFFEPE